MSNQAKKSIKQIFKEEAKLITLVTFIVLLIPVISEIIVISDLVAFGNLTVIQQLGAFLGLYDFTFTNVTILTIIGLVVSAISIPFIAAMMAHRLNGERTSQAIGNGFKAIGTKRFWNFNLKVYLPYVLVVAVVVVIMMLIPESTVLSMMANIIESTVLQVVIILLLAIISIVVATISGAIFVTNVAYMRGAAHIRDVLEFIPSREINKLLVFNLAQVLISGLVLLIFVVPMLFVTPAFLFKNILGILIGLIVVIILFQIVFLYLRFGLYMNIGSKIVPQDSRNKTQKGNKNNQVITESVESSKVYDFTESEQVSDPFELSIKPKSTKRKARFNNENNNKPKRSIK